jgi:hypothetical protein
MRNYLYFLVLAGLFLSGNFCAFAQNNKSKNQLRKPEAVEAEFSSLKANNLFVSRNSVFQQYFKKCSTDFVAQRIYNEYGAVFSANLSKVLLPADCFFQNDKEVKQFQNRAASLQATVNGIKVELQPAALEAYLSARAEAKKLGLDITPRFADSSGRSFANTVELWRDQISEGLNYWITKGKLTKKEASKIGSLSIKKQVVEVLKLEEDKIYFGNGFGKSILQSIAVPGGSQHNLLLALDIAQHDNPKIRAILAKYGWFQTVKNDAPHFTFLGLKESQLSAFGLRRSIVGGRAIWSVKTQIQSTKLPAAYSKNDVTNPPSTGITRARITGKKEPDGKPKKEDSLVKRALIILPSKNIPVTVSEDVILPLALEPWLRELTQKYYALTGRRLHITSGLRTPEKQARAMYFNLENYGISYVASTYGGRAAVWEIINAFQQSRNDKRNAVREMAEVIKSQMKRRIIISPHIREKALDIRSRGKEAANLAVLKKIVQGMRGQVLAEKDHYHVQF